VGWLGLVGLGFSIRVSVKRFRVSFCIYSTEHSRYACLWLVGARCLHCCRELLVFEGGNGQIFVKHRDSFRCAKTAEPVEMPFEMWTRVGPRKHVLDGLQIPTCEGAILRVKWGQRRTCPDVSSGWYTQSDSTGGSTGTVQMPTGVY